VRKTAISGALNPALLRWGGLAGIALAELTWLKIRFQMPSTGILSLFQGYVFIFVTSLAVVAVLVWASSRGKLLQLPIFQEYSHNPWPMVLAHWAAFALFFGFTIFVAEGDATSSPLAVFWVLAWAGVGLGAGVFWMLAAMPAKAWIRLFRQNAPLVWAGIIIMAAFWFLGFINKSKWVPLFGATFRVVEGLLSVLGQQVICQPAERLLGTEQFAVRIYTACAGYEGIGLISLFVGSYWWLFRSSLRFPQAFVLLPIGILVIWLVNAVRITLLILFGTYFSPEIAMGGFHAAGGWIGFIAVALGLVAISRRMPFFTAGQSEVQREAREGDLTAAYLAPLMALLAIILVTRAFSSGAGFDWFYPVRVLGTAAVLWFFWRSRLTGFDWAGIWSGSAVAIGAAVFVVWLGLEWALGFSEGPPALPAALAEMPAGMAAAWLIFRVLGSIITVPLAEELAFRGYALRRLVSPDFDKIPLSFTWLSFLLSSILFGALHGRWLAGTVAGMFYAWAMYRRGRVGDAIMAHATTNALIAADVLILGNWNLWN
jgi:exosortase E/protease (VPEID-CTERM system)